MAPSTGLEALVNPGRILLVEDNPDDVALTLRALKSHNITNVRQVDSALTTAGPAKRPHKQMCPNLCPGSTGSHQQGVLSRCAVERRRSESNRRIEVLQIRPAQCYRALYCATACTCAQPGPRP